MDFSNYKFRCSMLGSLNTNPQKKEKEAGLPSKTTQSYLRCIFIEEVYGRKHDFSNKQIEKGNLNEEDSLGLLGKIEGRLLIKNKEKFENDFICGTPDNVQDKVRDTKTSWNIFTYMASEMTKGYEDQLRGYMWLTGLKEATLAYCLVDTPDHLIYDEQQRLKWKMGVIDEDNDPLYLEACAQIEKNHRFGDIPDEKKVKQFHIKRSEEWEQMMMEKIQVARNYLNTLTLN